MEHEDLNAQCNSREGSSDDDNGAGSGDRDRNNGRRMRGGKSWVLGVVLWMAVLRLGS